MNNAWTERIRELKAENAILRESNSKLLSDLLSAALKLVELRTGVRDLYEQAEEGRKG